MMREYFTQIMKNKSFTTILFFCLFAQAVCGTVTEELFAESMRQIGVSNSDGDYSSTQALDGAYHNYEIITQGGYTEYDFTTTLKSMKIENLVYALKFDTAYYASSPGPIPPYLAASTVHVQFFNWRTLQWDGILTGSGLPSDPTVTRTIPASKDYISSATGKIRIRFHRHASDLLITRVHVDFQKLTVYADETQVSDSPCIDLDIMTATGRQKYGLSEGGSYTNTYVSDRNFHGNYIGNDHGYVLYEFESDVRTGNPEAEGITTLSEGYTQTHASDGGLYSVTFAPLLASGFHEYVVEFHTDATAENVEKIEYLSEWSSCSYKCHWGCAWYCYSMRAYIWNWRTGAWNTMWSSGGQLEELSTWTSTEGDYVGPDGVVRVLQRSGESYFYAPLRIDYQHIRVWEANPSPGGDELRVLIYEPEFYTDCEWSKITQMSIFNWMTLNWEQVLSAGTCYQAFYFQWGDGTSDPEDYVSGDGMVWVRYQRNSKLDVPVNVDFQEISLLEGGTPPLPPTTSTTTTTTTSSTAITTTTSSTTTTLTKSVSLSYRARDDHYIHNCSIWIDIPGTYTKYHTFYGVVNDETQTYVVDGVPAGSYHWFVECFDDKGQKGSDGPREFIVSG